MANAQGISAPIVGAALENATLFLVYAKCQAAILALNPTGSGSGLSLSDKALGKRRELSTPEMALAGAGAGFVTSFVL
jgi:ornithine carrier protein